MASSEDLAFGQIAVEKKFCTAAQVAECLELQGKERELGVLPKSLSDLLMEGGHLSQYLVKEIYKLQGKQEGFPQIEGYVVEAKIGHGGMGTVYRAVQQSLERVVAIKVLASNLARDREFVNRFMREARSVARLSHENIIVGIDVGVSGGHHFFAMEYVDGLTVHDILRMDGPMDETRALAIVRQIALALAHANEHSLVHRDVKPGNIMVIADGMAKLCDLGLAKSIHQDNHLTHTGTTHGTPHYMSPEQARGSADIDIRSDIYSLGATLYQMVVGEVPFTGASAAVVLLKHLSETVPSPRHRRVNLSDGVCHLIEKMMAKRVEHRYQTPRELLTDIDAVLAGESPVSERPSAGQSSVMPASAPPEASTSITDTPSDVVVDLGPQPVAPLHYKPIVLAAGSVAVGAVVMLVAMQLFGGDGGGAGGGEDTPDGPGTNTSVSAASSVAPPATAVTSQPPAGPDPAREAIETQAKEWLAELNRNVARYPDDFREHLHACEVLMRQFPSTLTAQKVRGIRSDLKAKWYAAADAALAAAIADHDALLRDDAFGEAIARVQEVADEFADTPAGTDATNRLRDLQGGRVERLADIRRAANEAEDDGDYALAIEHWKRALKLGDPDISGEATLQIERLEGLRRFAEAAAARRAARTARSHLHNFVHSMLAQSLVTRRHRAALDALREFAGTAEVAPITARLQREVEWVQTAAEAFEAAETALSEQVGKVVALRKRGVTDRLVSGTLQRFNADDGACRIKLAGTAGAVVTLAVRDLAVEDILRLGGAHSDTGEGRWIESAVRYCDNDLPGARNALTAAGEAGLAIDQRRSDLQELVAWRLLQETRGHWIAERYRQAGDALEGLQRRHGDTEVFTDHADEINGRAVLAPSYEERAEAVKLLSGDGAAKVFGKVATITATNSAAGPPHLGFSMDRLTFTAAHTPNWFLMDGDNDADLWSRTAHGTSGAVRTRLLLEPRMSGDAPLRVRIEFRAAKAPAGTVLTLAEPFPGQSGEHRAVRFVVGDGGAVLIVQERPREGPPIDLLRIDDLKLGSEGLHSIDVTLGEGRISVAVDGRATRSAAAGPRPGGHIVLDGHGPGLNYASLSVDGRLDPPWVLNDPKVRRLLTLGR